MEFLVTGRYTEPGPTLPADQVTHLIRERVVPALEMCADWVDKEGKVKAGGVFAGLRALAFVTEADTGEEIGQRLTSLPFWHDITWEVTPLQSFRSAAERETRLCERIEAAAQS